MKTILHIWILAIILLLSPSAFSANDAAEDIAMEAVDAAFSELERQIITGYYGEEEVARKEDDRKKMNRDDEEDEDDVNKKDKKDKKSKKDKKAKKKSGLPPGIAKKLERGGQLPPGIAKRYLPEDLEGKLPEVKKGFERIESEGKILLVEAATGIIVDMIDTITKPDRSTGSKDRDIDHKKSPEETGEPGKKWWQIWK